MYPASGRAGRAYVLIACVLKAYASRKNRACLRRRGIACTIPDKADHDHAHNRQKRGSRGVRPPHFDPVDYRDRHAVE
ncbi:hypothetical protein GCM10010433_73870 [Streptomyces pulveraceus]